jgi:hypothetical protein
MSNSTFDFNVFIKESKDVLVTPKSYFATMKTTGGIAEPLIKAVIYGVVAGVIAFILNLFHLSGMTGAMLAGVGALGGFFYYVIAAIIGLFISAVILLVISAICKGSIDFETNLRVTSSVMVVLPVMALLGLFGSINLTLYAILILALNIFTLYLLYHGLIETLKAKSETVKIVLIILVAIFVLLSIGTISRSHRYNKLSRDLQELKEDLNK